MVKIASDLTPKAMRTRAAILDAARCLIGEKGVDGLNVMEVCDVAGVGRTSFYNYFKDSDALTDTVAKVAAASIKNDFDALHETLPRGLERLGLCLTMVLKIAADDPETALLLTALAQHTPAIPGLLHEEIMQELAAAVQDGLLNIRGMRLEVLANLLKMSTLAICRQIACGELPKEQIDDHVAIMIGVCGSVA